MRNIFFGLTTLLCLTSQVAPAATSCGNEGAALQVLGSGDASLAGKRASHGLLLWVDGKARVLVNAGSGVALRFQESGAQWNDLDAILFTRIDVSHTADLPALLQAAQANGRVRALPVYGPTGNKFAPATVAYVRDLFDPVRGIYRHLGGLLAPLERRGYKLEPHDVRAPPAPLATPRRKEPLLAVFNNERLQIRAILKGTAAVPTVGWRVETGNTTVAIDDGTPDAGGKTAALAEAAALLVAPLPEAAAGREALLKNIAAPAQAARARQLLFTGRGRNTAAQDEELTSALRPHVPGLLLADDLMCVMPR